MGGHRIPANQPSSDPDPFRERVNRSRTSRAAPACVTRPFTITLKKTNRSTVTKDQTSHHRNHHPHRSSRVDAAPSRTAGNFFFFPITSTLSLSLSQAFSFFSRLQTTLPHSSLRRLRNRAAACGGFFSPPSERRRILVRRVLDQLSTRIVLSLHQLREEKTARR